MQILTKELQDKLLANARQQLPLRGTKAGLDFLPVVKLFTPDANATWLYGVGRGRRYRLRPVRPGVGYPELGAWRRIWLYHSVEKNLSRASSRAPSPRIALRSLVRARHDAGAAGIDQAITGA